MQVTPNEVYAFVAGFATMAVLMSAVIFFFRWKDGRRK